MPHFARCGTQGDTEDISRGERTLTEGGLPRCTGSPNLQASLRLAPCASSHIEALAHKDLLSLVSDEPAGLSELTQGGCHVEKFGHHVVDDVGG